MQGAEQGDGSSFQDELVVTPAGFGALATADHSVLGSFSESSCRGDTVAWVMHNHAAKWTECYPSPTNPAKDRTMGHCASPAVKKNVARLYTDGSGELSAAA